ncbi:hypothetical protein EOM81_10990 [bacterium]|nr:hypothetical protein [bacterium]
MTSSIYYEVFSRVFNNGKVTSVLVRHNGNKPENYVQETCECDIYHDYFSDFNKALEFQNSLK